MFIKTKSQLFVTISILLLFGNINTNVLKSLLTDTEDLMHDICDKLYDADRSSEENQQWEKFCKKWIKLIDHRQYEDIKTEDTRSGK